MNCTDGERWTSNDNDASRISVQLVLVRAQVAH